MNPFLACNLRIRRSSCHETGDPVRTTALIASLLGAVASGALGLSWLQDATRMERETPHLGQIVLASHALVAALVLGCVAGVFILQGRHRLAGTLCLAAGVAPGMLEPRAFVVTFLLLMAGLMAYGSAGQPPLRRTSRGQRIR
jgi:hypothetical protein